MKRRTIDKKTKETYDVIGHRLRLDLQAIIVTDLLPDLFAAAGGAHLGAAAPTLKLVVTIFNEIETITASRSRVPVYEERDQSYYQPDDTSFGRSGAPPFEL